MKLNQTPIRTARNYKINNIEIKDFAVPEKIKVFNSATVKNESSKIVVSNDVSDFELSYGVDKALEAQAKLNANQKYKINVASKTAKNVEFAFTFNKENSELVDNIEIVAEENSKATVIIKYEPDKQYPNCNKKEEAKFPKCYHNGILRVLAKQDANINVVVINLLSETSNNFLAIQNEIAENAKVKYTIVDFGGKNSITNFYSDVKGENGNSTLNTIYLGKDSQVLDLNYIVHLKGEKSSTEIEVQGALKDKAHKNFKGTIDFKQGCKHAKGSENENCMLLSDDTRSISLPVLLCTEEDVDGSHSASSGKVGEKELFYIMSRGFEYKEAMKLLVRANFNKILEGIPDEELKNKIINEIDERLD